MNRDGGFEKRSLRRNAILNGIKQSVSILFPLITFPYAARVLGAVEYGRYSFAVSVVNYFSLFAAFGISKLAIREGARIRDDKNKIATFSSNIFTFNLLSTIITYIAMAIMIVFSSKMQGYTVLIIVQSIGIILTTIGVDWINTIFEDFEYITLRHIFVHIIRALLLFAFVKSESDVVIYCAVMVFSSYGGNIINLLYVRKYVKPKISFRFNIRLVAIPACIFFVNSIATTIYVNSDITMLGFYLNDHDVGIYSFSSKLYNVIKYLLDALIIVLVPRLGYLLENNHTKYSYYVDRIFKLVLTLTIPIAFFLAFMSDSIIQLVGGYDYSEGVKPLILLSGSVIFALLSSIYCNCLLIINKLEKYTLISTSISAVVNVGLNFLLIPLMGINGAAITTFAAEILNFLIQRYFVRKKLGKTISFSNAKTISLFYVSFVTIFICVITNHVLYKAGLLYSALRVGVALVTILIATFVGLYFLRDESLWFLLRKDES